MHGDITYLELTLIHEKETLAFYASLFSWKMTQSFVSKQTYFMFDTPSQKNAGGFDAQAKPSQQGVLVYVQCDDIDGVLDLVRKDHPKAAIVKSKTLISKDYGSYALLLDPSGNLIGLQESIKAEG